MNRRREEGYLLLGLTVMIFILLLAMGIAAPLVAKDLQRQRELQSTYNAHEYVRAIQLFYRKTGHYPTAIEQLDETNNIHFLRRHFTDPLTKGEYRLILQGQNQTTVKGFFGEPLAGIQTSGMGSSSLGSSNLTTSSGLGGGTSGGGLGSTSGNGGISSGSIFPGNSGSSSTGTGTSSAPSGTLSSTSAADFKGSAGPFIGVGTTKTGTAIVAWNGEDSYDKWEFLYDPRVDALKQKVNILGGGVSSSNAGDLGNGQSKSVDSLGSSTSSPKSDSTSK